jgi:hypothetical protein
MLLELLFILLLFLFYFPGDGQFIFQALRSEKGPLALCLLLHDMLIHVILKLGHFFADFLLPVGGDHLDRLQTVLFLFDALVRAWGKIALRARVEGTILLLEHC